MSGTVAKGKGDATRVMTSHAHHSTAIGTRLHPGSINLLVQVVGPQYHFIRQSIYPQDIERNGWFKFCPCTLDGHDAFIVATWSPCHTFETGSALEHRDQTLFELMAASRIPGVYYGAALTLEYDPGGESVR